MPRPVQSHDLCQPIEPRSWNLNFGPNSFAQKLEREQIRKNSNGVRKFQPGLLQPWVQLTATESTPKDSRTLSALYAPHAKNPGLETQPWAEFANALGVLSLCKVGPIALEQFVTRKITIGHQGALEPVPPAFGLHAATPEDDWDRQIANNATAVVEPQLVE